MAADRLTVLGIRPVEWSVRPAGLHLRWAFPVSLGFPPGGFQVFRRPAKRGDPPCVDLTMPKDQVLPSGSTIGGVTLYAHDNVTLRGTGQPWLAVASTPLAGSAEPFILRMTFDGPAVAVEVRLRKPVSGNGIVLRAHDASGRVVAETSAQAPAGSPTLMRLRVDAPLIDHATLRLDFAELERLCVETHARACAEDWGRPVKELPLLEPAASTGHVEAMLAERLGQDVRNVHVQSLTAARERYGPGLAELLRWLRALVHGDSMRIRNPQDPSHRRLAIPTRRSPLRAVYPQAMLLLAALDPNVARVLSLGWVDRFGAAGEDPERGQAYDYKVLGRWSERELCGLLLGLGATVSPRPQLDSYADAVVLPGLRWQGADPLRRVGVRWRRPPLANVAQAAVAPVLFQVRRAREVDAQAQTFGPLEDLTSRRHVLVPVSSWETALGVRFVDAATPLGRYRYSVAGIDLFGQIGSPIAGLPVDVRDLEAPPPPVRVSATLTQPGYPWLTPEDRALAAPTATCAVRFEYGPFQLRQAPDAVRFSLFWRAGTLVDTEPVTIRVVSREPAKGNRHAYVVELLQVRAGDSARFERAILVPGWTGDPMPAAAERPRLRVAEVESEDLPRPRLRLAPSAIELPAGQEPIAVTVLLDSRRRSGWREAPGVSVPVRPPVAGTLVGDAETGQALTVRVRAIDAPPAPAPLPSEAPGDLVAPITGFDVFISRALLEPDLFRAGAAQGPGGALPIHSSGSGRAAVDDSALGRSGAARVRVGLDDMTPLAAGDTLTLPVGPAGGHPQVRFIEMTTTADPGPVPGGELAFEVTRGGKAVLVSASVVSDVERQGPRLGFLVRFPESLPPTAWPRAGDIVRYFPPYAIAGLSVALAAAGDVAPLRLAIASGQGAAMAYLALGTTDLRGNAGRLSPPVPIIIVRPPPPAPGPPFPCQAPPAPEGFATPPDRQGRATLCVGWTLPASAATLRFEVARALDQTIIATDRRNWLIGRAAPGRAPATLVVTSVTARADGALELRADTAGAAGLPDDAFAGGLLWQGGAGFRLVGGLTRIDAGTVTFVAEPAAASAVATVGAADLYAVPVPPRASLPAQVSLATFDAERGLHHVSLVGAGGGSLAALTLDGGCLVQGGRRFQITLASTADGLTLLLRRVAGAGDPIVGDDCVLEPPPDYSAVAGHTDKIRLLADKAGNEDAFGLVTGVPVAGTQFRDEIAGAGRDPFFYRARAVDPAENRSAWSPTSVPFWPVDTTPPEPPGDLRVTVGDRTATLAWSRPAAPITRYEVLRTVGGTIAEDAGTAPHASIGLADLTPRPLTVVAGGIVLPRPLRFEVDGQLGLEAIAVQLLQSIRVAPRRADPGVNLVDPAASRAVFAWAPTGTGTLGVTVTALAGLVGVAPGVPVVVSAGSQVIDGDPAAWSWTDQGLTGGTTYAYRLAAVKTVRAAPAAPGGPPRELAIPSLPSATVSVRALDRSPVPAPAILGAAWADTAAGVATALSLALRAEGTRPAALRVERRAAPDASWEIATLDNGWGWVAWPVAGAEATVLVTRAAASTWWELRVAVRLSDGRTSPVSGALVVSA
jgi:hypothetical protein